MIPVQKSSLTANRVMLGIPPVSDENHQNARIQQAVNRYNGLTSSLWKPSNMFKCNLFKSKLFKSTNGETYSTLKNAPSPVTAENRYDCAGSFPRVFLNQQQGYERRHAKSENSPVTTDVLPVSRYLENSSSKFMDLSPTRAVLDVLQDFSRKRIHCKDEDDEENVKRRCRGLAGDIPQDGLVPYKPLFVSPSKTASMVRKDQTTQTTIVESSCDVLKENDIIKEVDVNEKLRKLPRKSNAILASLSSSVGGPWLKRKRDVPVTNGTFNYLKKPKVTHSKEVGTTKLSALERRPKSDLSFSSSKIDDRMTNIYFDLEYSPTIKKTVLETLRSNPSSPTIGNTSKENVEGNIKSTVVTTEGKNESLSSSLPSCPSSTVFDTTNSITKSTQNIPYSNDILGHLPKKYSDLPTTNMQLSQVPSLDIHNNKKATSPVQHPIHNTSNKLSSNNDSDVNQKPSISEGIDEKATKCVPSSIANDNDTKSISSPDGDSQLSILPSEKNNITTLLTGTTSVFSRLDSPAISSGATTLPTSGVNLRSYDTSNVSSGSKTNTGFVINSASFQSFSKEGNSSQSQNIGSTNIEGVHSEKPFPTFHFGAKSVDDSKATFSSLASNIANVPSTETKSVVPNVHDSPLKIDNTSVSISTSNTFADLASEPVKNTSLQGGLFNFGQSKVQSPAKVSSAPFTFSAVTSEGLAQKDESHKDVSVPQFSFGSQQTSAATVVARDTMQPTFSLSNPKMSESSSVDIVQNDQEKAVAISKSSFTFGNNNGKPNFMFASNENKIDIHKGLPVVSTVNTLTGQSTLPMFTGNKSASETKTSSLAFGDNKQVNTSFTFGNIQQNAVSSTTPLFSFGNKQQSTIRAPDSESKTGFSFETNGTKSVPFGSAANPTTSESFLFGNGQKSNTITTTSAFTFGSGQQQQTTNTTSVFGQTLTTTTTSAFSKTQTSTFGQPQTSTIPSAFGQLASIPTTSAFGQQDSSVKQGFGQPQTPLSLSSSTAFGQTSNSFGQPQSTLTTTFGQPQTLSLPPAFGQQQTPATPTFGMQSSSTNAFSQNSTITGFGQPPTSSATTPFSQPATSGITAFGQTQNPAPAFGQQQKNVDPPQFAFGGSSTSTFGQQSTATQNKPTFNFGNTQQPNNSSSAQPTFSFGSTVPLKTPTTSASTFSFGGGTVNQTPSASTFAFGNGQQKEQPRNSPFPFGSPQTITTAATSSPAFSFGSSKAGSQSSNTFKFGSNQQIAAPSSATFGFGDTTSAPSAAPTSFNFGSANGGNNDVKPGGPVFSFGSPAPNPSAPAFKFGSADATSNQNTGFPFGSTQGGFSFGQAPQSAPSSNPPSTPNTPVGFAIPGTFSIGSGSSQSRTSRSALRRRRP